MLIKLFRSSSSYQVILLVIFALLLWLPAFIKSPAMPQPCSVVPVFDFLRELLLNHPLLASLIAFVLMFAEALVLNLILVNEDLSPRNSALPAYIYIILTSWQNEALTLSPALLANAFLITFLFFFLKVYEMPDAFREVFSASFCIALASFVDFPVIVLLLVIWFGFFVFRVLSWREWLISLSGIVIPYSLVFAWFFLNDQHQVLLTNFSKLIHLQPFAFRTDVLHALIWGILAFFLLSALWKVLNVIQEKVINIRKNFIFITWFFLLSLILLFISGDGFRYQVLVAMLPASILLSYHLSVVKRLFWWETLFATFIFLLILIRIF